VDETLHVRHVVPYIHLNPVRARLVLKPEQAVWALCMFSSLTHPEVGKALGISSAHVGVVLGRIRKGESDERLRIWMDRCRFWLEESSVGGKCDGSETPGGRRKSQNVKC